MKQALRYAVFAGWLLSAAYFTAAGYYGNSVNQATGAAQLSASPTSPYVVYDGLTFASIEEVQAYVAETTGAKWFPFLFELPSILIPLMTTMGIGALGTCITLTARLVIRRERLEAMPYVIGPLFGALIGTAICFVAIVSPTWLPVDLSPGFTTLLFISFLAGLVYEQSSRWLAAKAKGLFE